MLERIHRIKGIGLLHDANGGPFAFAATTLLYAENGCGKSTLASILRSCSTGDATLIETRKTIDGTEQPTVQLQFGNGNQATFTNGRWTSTKSELLVFDSDFVQKNVYSGTAVSSDQRQGLLEFALGQHAVVLRASVDLATSNIASASSAAATAERALNLVRKSMALAEFASLPPILNVDEQLATLQKRAGEINSKAAIQNKATPQVVQVPDFNLEGVFAVLSQTLKDIEVGAEERVQRHVAQYGSPSIEGWLSQGHQFQHDDQCPYCSQSTKHSDLIAAYRTHFNKAYQQLKTEVLDLSLEIELKVNEAVVERFVSQVERSRLVAQSWSDLISLSNFDFDEKVATAKLSSARRKLADLVLKKQQRPLDPADTPDEKAEILSELNQIRLLMEATNKQVAEAIATVNAFKAQLAIEDRQAIESRITFLQLTKARHEPKVVAQVTGWQATTAERKAQEEAKAAARAALDSLMKGVLSKYQDRINALLGKFGAAFKIVDMGFNYYGATPRSEYGLQLRGKTIQLSGGVPSFATALSDGDKRTLALAFFVASVEADPTLADRILVVDDPMSSLDRNRREHTRRALKDLGSKAAQLIMLSHDLYFLRDLKDDATPKSGPGPKTLGFKRIKNGYTDFTSLDLDKECEADYYRNHRLLSEFSAGTGAADARTVAKAIRPMLEGYLHRRFPGRVSRRRLFGEIVADAVSAKSPDPLTYLQTCVEELNEINTYAGQFHHDTNAAADSVPVVDAEVKAYAERALQLVHKGGP